MPGPVMTPGPDSKAVFYLWILLSLPLKAYGETKTAKKILDFTKKEKSIKQNSVNLMRNLIFYNGLRNVTEANLASCPPDN